MLGEVELLGGVESILGVKDAVVVDQAVEAVSVSVDPARRKGGKQLILAGMNTRESNFFSQL